MRVVDELPALKRYALSLTRNESDADDLVHDTLLRAYDKRATFDESRSLRVWLFAILHNLYVDAQRRRRNEAAQHEEAALTLARDLAASQESAVRTGQILRAFAALSDEQRAVLHLVAVEGLSYIEAAEALAIPIGTLMSRLARARAALRAWEDGAARGTTLRIVGGRDDSRE